MLTLDALAKRLLLGALAGLIAARWWSGLTAALVAVAVAYVLVVVRRERNPWQ